MRTKAGKDEAVLRFVHVLLWCKPGLSSFIGDMARRCRITCSARHAIFQRSTTCFGVVPYKLHCRNPSLRASCCLSTCIISPCSPHHKAVATMHHHRQTYLQKGFMPGGCLWLYRSVAEGFSSSSTLPGPASVERQDGRPVDEGVAAQAQIAQICSGLGPVGLTGASRRLAQVDQPQAVCEVDGQILHLPGAPASTLPKYNMPQSWRVSRPRHALLLHPPVRRLKILQDRYYVKLQSVEPLHNRGYSIFNQQARWHELCTRSWSAKQTSALRC